ncbi:Uncharacterised protein [Yersinia similis]|nr:Uncharacterised protein [Yersinia similis]
MIKDASGLRFTLSINGFLPETFVVVGFTFFLSVYA